MFIPFLFPKMNEIIHKSFLNFYHTINQIKKILKYLFNCDNLYSTIFLPLKKGLILQKIYIQT